MKTAIDILALLLLLGPFSPTVRAQNLSLDLTVPEKVGISSDSLRQMNAYFHRLVDQQQLAGIQTAVMHRGRLIHFDSYGYANIAEARPLDAQSIFRIFSMTKPIVTVGLLQLYEAGKFSLADPLSRYLPEFEHPQVYTDSGPVPAQNPLRIIDLLRHTSGYSYGVGPYPELNQMYVDADLREARDNAEFVRRLSQLPLQFEPGTDWQYGYSTNVCGHLIEVLSGQPLDRYLEEHVLQPLDMQDTHFQLPAEKIDRFTVGYGWQEEVGLTIVEAQRDNRYITEVTCFNGGGGLVSTTLDYLKFCRMIQQKGKANGQRILRPATVALMLRDQLGEVRRHQERLRLPPGEAGFGLGFAIRGAGPQELEPVYGWGGAVGTYFKIDQERDLVYVLMIQLSPYRQLGLRQLFQDFVEAAVID
ncbi:MAG: serine hydrolase domain-containing protein [Bacteroidota bacterium]